MTSPSKVEFIDTQICACGNKSTVGITKTPPPSRTAKSIVEARINITFRPSRMGLLPLYIGCCLMFGATAVLCCHPTIHSIYYIYIYLFVCVCLYSPHITTLFGVSLRLFHTQFFWLLHMHHTIIATVPATSEVSFLHISKKYITHIIKLLHSWFNNSSQSGFVPHTSTFATLNEHMSIVRLVKRTVP
jgi:hypothetical protein